VVAFRALVLREFLGSVDLARRELADHLSAGSATLGIVAASVLVASALARLVTQSVAMHGEFSVSLSGAMLVHSSWGASWLLQTVAALGTLLALFAARRGSRAAWLVASSASLVLAATPALSGHALASPRLTVLAVIADAVHVLGAGIWLGSLLTLLVVGLPAAVRLPAGERGPAAADLVNGFSTTALAGAALLVATGVFAAWLHLGSFSALWRSSYGRVLIAKLAVLCALIATGAYNWRRVRPAMSDEVGPRRLRRSATLELVVGAIVVAITAVLVALPTPVDLT